MSDDEYREPCEGPAYEDGDLPWKGAGAHVSVSRGVDVTYGFVDVGVSVVLLVGRIGHFWFVEGRCRLLSDGVAAGYGGGGGGFLKGGW